MSLFPSPKDLELMSMLARAFPRECFDARQMQHFIDHGGRRFLAGLFSEARAEYEKLYSLPEAGTQMYIPFLGKNPSGIQLPPYCLSLTYVGAQDLPKYYGAKVVLRPVTERVIETRAPAEDLRVAVEALYSLQFAFPFAPDISIFVPYAAWRDSDGGGLFPFITGRNGSWFFDLKGLQWSKVQFEDTWLELEIIEKRLDTGS